MENSIPVSIGILTYNSGKTLERCLDSLKGFNEIIIADGGSDDNTLTIAKKYQCKIIKQSQQNKPIVDFAKERNLMLAAATQPWFFYLDADEIMSAELRHKMREISTQVIKQYQVYQVAYHLVNQDNSKIYRQFKTYYQPRFFATDIGAEFIKPVHERIQYDKNKFKTGRIREPWYVPLDIQLDFSVYRDKVHHRLGLMADKFNSRNLRKYLIKGIFGPLSSILKQLIKILLVRLKYRSDEILPLHYELFRIYSYWYLMLVLTKKYLKNVKYD